MARFPGAIWKPITAGKGRQRLTVYNRVNLHVAVSEGPSLHAYFNKTGIPDSHFYVRRDGTVEQYVDTAYRAFADLEGNDATISVETQGMGGGTWTPQQVEALAQLYVWAVRTHGIARKVATSSKPGESSKGLSWHRLGIDGNFPALPNIRAGRTQRGGGMRYSSSRGKECPGSDRIPQIPTIFARAEAILDDASKPTTPHQEEPMAEGLDATQAKQLSNVNHFATAKVVDDFDGKQTVVDALRRLLIITRRNNDAVVAAVAEGVKSYAATTPGVDEKALTEGVVAEVRKTLDAVEGREYVLTPKES
jgi:hypothetical protein